MIYTDSQLKEKIVRMIESFENEVVEFKEARTNYSFNDIGKYFSALSNEANLRGLQEAWLIFGISDDKRYVGTEFRKQGSLQSLKKEIVNGTNERLTFLEIYELTMEKCRVIAFQIPPAIRGIPTTWQGAAYAREHESISPLPMNKVDLLRSQIGMDWSKEIVEDATIEDLDEEAIKRARELFSKRQSDRKKAQEVLKKLSDIEVLNKAGITIKGKITRTALLLLGKSEAKYFFDGFIPRITWTLYNADNSVKAYEHFDIPMLMAVDKVYSRIRNVKYRYIAGQQTLFPDEVDQYEPELIKEIINNCIAHQDYRLRGKINVEEFEDRLVFINEGAFIPETIEQAFIESYRLLCQNNKDVLDEFIARTEETLSDSNASKQLAKVEKDIAALDAKRAKLVDMRLEEIIDKDTYEQKYFDLSSQIEQLQKQRESLQESAETDSTMKKRIAEFRRTLEENEVLDTFDRYVFESIVEKVIVGGYDEDGNKDPSMLTFIYKTGFKSSLDGTNFKPPRKNSKAAKQSAGLCSHTTDEAKSMCSYHSDDTRGVCGEADARIKEVEM